MRAVAALALLVLAGACARDGEPARDGAVADLRPLDAASADSPLADALTDAGPGDAFVPAPGFGALSGQCGVLDDDEWDATTTPFLFRNAIDFGTQSFDANKLTPGGKQIWTEGNRGGSSEHSEVIAFEVLHRCELAQLIKSETKIEYRNAGGKKTDMLVQIDARRVGVSVTRAYHYPPSSPYTAAEARTLLDNKLAALPLSRANGKPPDTWTRSVLHVMAYDRQHADVVQQVWAKQVSAATKGNAILVLTVTDGKDDFVY